MAEHIGLNFCGIYNDADNAMKSVPNFHDVTRDTLIIMKLVATSTIIARKYFFRRVRVLSLLVCFSTMYVCLPVKFSRGRLKIMRLRRIRTNTHSLWRALCLTCARCRQNRDFGQQRSAICLRVRYAL